MKTKLLITGMLLVLFACSGYAQGTWTRKADFGGVARTEATGFTIGDKIYLGLGNNGP